MLWLKIEKMILDIAQKIVFVTSQKIVFDTAHNSISNTALEGNIRAQYPCV